MPRGEIVMVTDLFEKSHSGTRVTWYENCKTEEQAIQPEELSNQFDDKDESYYGFISTS